MHWGLLPFEIVTSILSWLPVKSLLRFRCVCKECRSLIDSPSFIKEHHACTRALGRLAFISTRFSSPEISLYDFGGNEEVRYQGFNTRLGDLNGYTISNPVNGLVCLGYCNSDRYDEGVHYLLNPATRELAMLPKGRNGGPWDYLPSLGFGFESSTGGYKVVKLFCIEGDSGNCGCKVLDLGTQECREVGRAPCGLPGTGPVLLNGAIHWASMSNTTVSDNFFGVTIVAFNLKDEKFRSIPVPHECRAVVALVYLGEWEGMLCLVMLPPMHWPGYDSPSMSMVRIWRMEDYATCRWREAHCSQLPNYESIDGQLSLVGISGHEMLLVLSPDEGLRSICSYDLRTSSLCELYNEQYPGELYDEEYPGALRFLTGSLLSPRCILN